VEEANVTRVAGDAEVRAATVDDAAAIADVHVAAWRAAYRGILLDETLDALDVDARAARWRDILRNPGTIVAVRQDRVVGFGSFGPARADEDRGCGEIYGLYVHPDAWGSSAGQALIDEMEAELRAAGHEEAMLWVLAENPRARRFYERNGWHDDDGRDVFDRDGSKAAIARHRKRLAE
jgi:GNAT superfamily N-acetyltransferase